MIVGVDFGTTRIVVAAADRGNFPLISFDTPDGQVREWYPPLVAVRGDERLYGWDTWPVLANPEWTVLRSLKRLLKDAGPNTAVEVTGQSIPLQEMLTQLLVTLRRDLLTRSSLHTSEQERLQAMVGVPANANSNQRFLTTEAFRAAGFEVLGLLNEPSAASIEFGHRDRAVRTAPSKRTLLVYDLGGGTFDASLVETAPEGHVVIETASVPTLGGDDFDELLADIALQMSGHADEDLSAAELFRLYEECREKKESLNPNTRRVVVDLDRVRAGWGDVSLAASEFYELCRPLIERTREVVEQLLASDSKDAIDTLYVTGGGAELPAVARILKESFGRRVRRSSYMRSATAIGLAISADAHSGLRLRDRLSQNFGVWREADAGSTVVFDVLLPGGTELPAPGGAPVRVLREYQPAHNIGHFRFLECSRLSADGQPFGDLTVWDEVRFPFDASLKDHDDLASVSVTRRDEPAGQSVEEEYSCDANGNIRVRISNRSAGYSREYRLGNWSGKDGPAKPARKRQAAGGHKHRR